MEKFYTAKYDKVFKAILCDENDKGMLQEFLSRTLKKKIEVIEFLRNELPITNVYEKSKIVDVLVKMDNEYVHIELNNGYSDSIEYLHNRNYIYFSNIFCTKTRKGDKYDYKSKFIHIDFTYKLNDEEDYRIFHVQDDKKKKYINNIEIIEYNMDKIMSYWYHKNEEKIKEFKHLIMLDLDKKDLREISEGDTFMESFDKKLEELNETETWKSAISYEEDQVLCMNTEKQISYEKGIEKGIQEGIEQSVIEFYKNGVSKDLISKSLNISIEEIDKLLNERTNNKVIQ